MRFPPPGGSTAGDSLTDKKYHTMKRGVLKVFLLHGGKTEFSGDKRGTL